jgi:hypothetical protein
VSFRVFRGEFPSLPFQTLENRVWHPFSFVYICGLF